MDCDANSSRPIKSDLVQAINRDLEQTRIAIGEERTLDQVRRDWEVKLAGGNQALTPEQMASVQAEYDSFIERGRPEGRAAVRPSWESICTAPEYRAADESLLPNQHCSQKVLAWRYGPRGMVLHGVSRQGKSMTGWLLMRRLYNEGYSIRAFDGMGWSFEVARAFRDMEHAERWMARLTRVDVLFLDDIFRGNFTTPAQQQALWGVIERRTTHWKPCVLITNKTAETIRSTAEQAGKARDEMDPILERIKEFCIPVPFI